MKKSLKYIILIILIAFIIGLILLNMPKSTEIPNVVGMTVEQAEKIANEANWVLGVKDVKGRNVEDKQAIIISQFWEPGDKLTEDSIFIVYVEEMKDIETIEKTLRDFANTTKEYNASAVKYSDYSVYNTTTNGNKIYKIKYITSTDYLYYYQLVSLDQSNMTVEKSTRFFTFVDTPNGGSKGETLEMQQAYQNLWGNK